MTSIRRSCAAALLLACGVLLPARLGAQVVRGVALDDGSRAPVAAVELVVRDSAGTIVATVRSGADGRFRAEVPAAGRYTLTSRHIAYAAITSSVVLVGRGEEVVVEIRLRAEAVALEPVRVVARRYPDEPRLREFYLRGEANKAVGRGVVLMREDVAALGPFALRQALDRAPRHAPGCMFFFYIDGMQVASMRELETVAAIEDIEGIEIYSDPAHVPARFQQRTHGCYNVFLAWRKPYGESGRPRSWRRFVVAGAATAAMIFLFR
jgi:hypothetical protein